MGSQGSSGSSRPLTAQERNEAYWAGLNNIARYDARSNGGVNEAWLFDSLKYDSPNYNSMSDGDYNRLEQNILQSRTAGLDRAKSLDSQALDESLSKRGIWSSGLAARAQNDLNERYAGNYAAAGGDAATQRYGMQQQDLTARNAFNQADAQQKWQSKWKPAEFLQGLYNGTGGVISNSGSSGWSI